MSGACPVCGSEALNTLLVLRDLPVFCNVQFATREEAIGQSSGDLTFTECMDCNHFFNSSFDENLLSYGQSYENSLHFSPTFSRFASGVAERLVELYDLQRKRVLDIGCGKGDFLSLLCELGDNQGFGFDKSFEEGRTKTPERGSVQYFKEYFTGKHADLRPDLVTCRHVLEHMPQPARFLEDLADALRNSPGCQVYFEVPNAAFTVRDLGIWDLIYEHCQYFTARSLRTAFAQAGFSVSGIFESFGGQYLCLDGAQGRADQAHAEAGGAEAAQPAQQFKADFEMLVNKWKSKVQGLDGTVVIWGAGSKGVTFLNLLQLGSEVAGIVDVNPHKQGKFTPITGHEIVSPEALVKIRPDHALVMNPLYEDEIVTQLRALGLSTNVSIVE